MTLFVGYTPDEQLPIKPGDLVTIRKGVLIHTTRPRPGRNGFIRKKARKTYKVRVDHILNGTDRYFSPPSVRWPGSGGYWYEVSINDIPEVANDVAYAQTEKVCTKCGTVRGLAEWRGLPYVGILIEVPSEEPEASPPGFIEMRNCPCGNTLAMGLVESWPEHLR